MSDPLDNIPEELRRLKGWLVWKYEHAEGEPKPRKVPYYANGRRRSGKQGSEADRARLVTFTEAAGAALALPDVEGVGLAMLPEWGIVGLDFDGCMVDGQMLPEVAVAVAGTYSEVSPSGRGVRAFVTGSTPSRKSNGAGWPFGFETFSDVGFLTVTGNITEVAELTWPGRLAHLNGAVTELISTRFARAEHAIIVAREPVGMSDDALRALLVHHDPDAAYRSDDPTEGAWVKVGMALHHETGGDRRGLDLWDEWSQRGTKYAGRERLEYLYSRFSRREGASAVTAGWLQMVAEKRAGGVIDDGSWSVVGAASGEPGTGGSEGGGAEAPEYPPFDREKSGAIKPTVTNSVMALRRADLCGMRVAYDEFRDEITVSRPGVDEWVPMTDADVVRMRMGLERIGFKTAPKELARDALVLVAAENQYDSAQLWLRAVAKTWDGKRRVDAFLPTYMGAQDTPYSRAVGRYLWTALAGRVLEPGVKADMVVIYEGAQGLRKSTAIEAIAPAPEFFVEVDLGDKEEDTVRKLRGALVGEIAELSGLHTKELEAIKKFVVRKVEKWVPKYKEFPSTFARRLVFIGTTNRTDILADDTGNRRWLPVHVEFADAEGIARDRQQLWAEAALMFGGEFEMAFGVPGGVAWRDAERLGATEHDAFLIEDPWGEPIRRWLVEVDGFGRVDSDGAPGADGGSGGRGSTPFTVQDLMVGALGLSSREMDRLAQKRVGAILRRFGYSGKTCKVDGLAAWRWSKD